MNIKQELLFQCKNKVDLQLQTIQNRMESYQQDLHSETKSSAGDKHETSRAMLQLEMEKLSQQLEGIFQMQAILDTISVDKISKKVCLGSIVFTEKTTYFMSVSLGKLTISDEHYFAISTVSPIGKLLLGKQENDAIFFQENHFKIQKIG